MELITAYELDELTLDELYALYHRLRRLLAQTAPKSPEHRNCLASMENVCWAIHQRIARGFTPGPGP